MRTNKLNTLKGNIYKSVGTTSKQELVRYPSEEKKLRALLTDDVWELFKCAGAIIAGGAITSIFTNKEVNDIDVYFRSEESLFRTVASIYNCDDYLDDSLVDIVDNFSLIYNGSSQRTLMFKNKEQDVQFMTFKYFKDVHEIFDTFDFTCCMGAYDFSAGGFILHKDFLKHNSQKYLKFNPGTAYPIMSLMRVDKYRNKGYEISKSELLRVCITCMNLGLTSWEDVKDHVGGMYGYDLNDVFNENKDFTLEEVVLQLSDIDERDIKLFKPFIVDSAGFWDAVSVFIKPPTDGEEEKIVFNDNKYLYKCVDSNWESPMSSKKIRYLEGAILDTKEHGSLYFHESSTKPFTTTKYWVECEIIGEGNVDKNLFLGSKTELRSGKVKVVRNFIYDPHSMYSELYNYVDSKYMLEDDVSGK